MHVPFFSLWKPFDRSWDHLTSLGPTIFQDNRNDDIYPEKTRANTSALKSPQAISTAYISLKPVQSTNFCRCMSHCPTFEHRLTNLGHTMFQDNRVAAICPEKLVPTALHIPAKFSMVSCKTKPAAATNVLPCMSHFSAFGNRLTGLGTV